MTGLLAALVDDAGLFPPTALSMTAALGRHRDDLTARNPMLTHRFLCPAARLDELREHLLPGDRIRLGLIGPAPELDGAAAVADADPRLRLTHLETVCGPGTPGSGLDTDLDALIRAVTAPGVPVFVEAADRADTPRLAAALAGRGAGLKIRCGGVRPDLFPTAAELADALVAAAAAGIPVKATAGLHHAVRHRDPATGFPHHGFLNLVVAAARAAAGTGPTGAAGVTGALLSTDGAALATEAAALDPAAVAATRALLTAYGSCSTVVPPAEAAELGLTPADPAEDPSPIESEGRSS